MQLCLLTTVTNACSALLIAIDNLNTVCEIGLYQSDVYMRRLCVIKCRYYIIVTPGNRLLIINQP